MDSINWQEIFKLLQSYSSKFNNKAQTRTFGEDILGTEFYPKINQQLEVESKIKAKENKKQYIRGFIFIGEKPKKEGDVLLNNIIKAMELNDSNYVLKFFDHKQKSNEFYNEVINTVSNNKGYIVLSLGSITTELIVGRKDRLSLIHGKPIDHIYKTKDGKKSTLKLFPIYHPDYLVLNTSMKKVVWDLLKLLLRDFKPDHG